MCISSHGIWRRSIRSPPGHQDSRLQVEHVAQGGSLPSLGRRQAPIDLVLRGPDPAASPPDPLELRYAILLFDACVTAIALYEEDLRIVHVGAAREDMQRLARCASRMHPRLAAHQQRLVTFGVLAQLEIDFGWTKKVICGPAGHESGVVQILCHNLIDHQHAHKLPFQLTGKDLTIKPNDTGDSEAPDTNDGYSAPEDSDSSTDIALKILAKP